MPGSSNTDERDISLPSSDLSILAGVRDENQRELLKQTMQSNAYKTAELISRAEQLEKENRRLQSLAPEAERAIAAEKKANENLKTAEEARTAAERTAEEERFARINAEEERDGLLASLRAASKQQSRLDRVIEQHGATD